MSENINPQMSEEPSMAGGEEGMMEGLQGEDVYKVKDEEIV